MKRENTLRMAASGKLIGGHGRRDKSEYWDSPSRDKYSRRFDIDQALLDVETSSDFSNVDVETFDGFEDDYYYLEILEDDEMGALGVSVKGHH